MRCGAREGVADWECRQPGGRWLFPRGAKGDATLVEDGFKRVASPLSLETSRPTLFLIHSSFAHSAKLRAGQAQDERIKNKVGCHGATSVCNLSIRARHRVKFSRSW